MFEHVAQWAEIASSETWATRATWATETQKAKKSAASKPACPVAQNENAWATVGNKEPGVALVAQSQKEWATDCDSQKTAENKELFEPVAHVAHVAQKNDKAGIAEWDAEAWQAHFDERAGIAEHDGDLSRGDAEQRAFECCVVEWQWRNPPSASGPEWCAHCGEPLGEPGRDGLPYLTGDDGHVWLHSGCHGDWTARRRAEAVAALAILGLPIAPTRSDLPHRIRGPAQGQDGGGDRHNQSWPGW